MPSKSLTDFIREKLEQHSVAGVEDVVSVCNKEGLLDIADLTEFLSSRPDALPFKAGLVLRKATLPDISMLKVTNVKTMDVICTNYGVISALVLTMTVGCFSATPEDWATVGNSFATSNPNCTDTSAPPSCTDTPASYARWMELFFVMNNTCASMLLIMVILFSAWLHVAVHSVAGHVEEALIVKQFRHEFFMLNALFMVAIVWSGFGLSNLIAIKCSTEALANITEVIFRCTGGVLLFAFVWLFWQVRFLSRRAKRARIDSV